MTDADLGFGGDTLQFGSNFVNVGNAIVNKEDLAATIEFAHDGSTNQVVVPASDVGFDAESFGGRRL